MFEQAVQIAAALQKDGGIILALVLFALLMLGGLVFVVKEFQKVNDKFIAFIERQETEAEKRAEAREKSYAANNQYMFNLIQTLVGKLNKNEDFIGRSGR